MKITKQQLTKIIREERALLNENWWMDEKQKIGEMPPTFPESANSEYANEAGMTFSPRPEERHQNHVAAGSPKLIGMYIRMQLQDVSGEGLKPEELEQLKSLQANPDTGSEDVPYMYPAIVDRLPDFHDPASQEKFRSMSGTAKPATLAADPSPPANTSPPANRGKRHSYDARVLEPMGGGMHTNADAVDGVLADLQRVGANDLVDEVDMMIQYGDDDIYGVLAMIPNSIKDKLSEGRRMKITKRQLRESIGEYVKDFFDPQGIFTGAGAGVDEDELRSSSTQDAWRLFKALAGLGTDEDEIESVFARRRNAPGGLSKLSDEYSMILKNLNDQRGGLRTNAIKGALGFARGRSGGALRDIGINMLQKYSVKGDDLERWLRDDGEHEFADEVRDARVTQESLSRHRPRNILTLTHRQLKRIIKESIRITTHEN